jgi:hypothetical protein
MVVVDGEVLYDMPADKLSRGMAPDELHDSRIWWNGPEFLKLPESEWPDTILEINGADKEAQSKEMRKTFIATTSNPLLTLIETRFSSMQRVVNTIAYLRRLAFDVDCRSSPLSIDEREYAMKFSIRWLLQALFPDEYKFFLRQIEDPQSTEKFPKKSSLTQLHPFMNEDRIICVGGQLSACPALTEQQKQIYNQTSET